MRQLTNYGSKSKWWVSLLAYLRVRNILNVKLNFGGESLKLLVFVVFVCKLSPPKLPMRVAHKTMFEFGGLWFECYLGWHLLAQHGTFMKWFKLPLWSLCQSDLPPDPARLVTGALQSLKFCPPSSNVDLCASVVFISVWFWQKFIIVCLWLLSSAKWEWWWYSLLLYSKSLFAISCIIDFKSISTTILIASLFPILSHHCP